MNLQMTEAPTIEIAMGKKMSAFATASPRRKRSVNTAMNKPSPVANAVTENTHHKLFQITPPET